MASVVYGPTGVNFSDYQTTSPYGSMANELLDHYEEGTWTPGLQFGAATTGISFGATNGSYRRIGGFVAAETVSSLSSVGSATGTAELTNLPFTAQNVDATTRITGVLTYMASFTSMASRITWYGQANTNFASFIQSGQHTNTFAATAQMTNANFGSSTAWRGMLFWPTA